MFKLTRCILIVSCIFSTSGPLVVGQISFQKTFSGASVGAATSVQQTSDGGLIIVGTVISSETAEDVYLIKTDLFGNILWTKTYGSELVEWGNSVHQTTDGGYIVVGTSYMKNPQYTTPHITLIKTDPNGDTLWKKNYVGLTQEDGIGGLDVRQTADEGYVISGTRYSDVYLLKTNSSGDTIWTKTYDHIRGGFLGNASGGFIRQTSDNGYIISDNVSYSQTGEAFLLKIDSAGDTLWTRRFGGEGHSVIQTSDSGYILAAGGGMWGFPSSVPLPNIYKTNSYGDLLWYKTYSDSLTDVRVQSVQQTTDGGYIMAGSIDYLNTIALIKTNSLGDTLWTRKYGFNLPQYYENLTVEQTNDEGYVIAGNYYFNGSSGIFLIKTLENGSVVSVETNSSISNSYLLDQNYPNPFNPSTIINYSIPNSARVELTLFNLLGEKVAALVDEEKPAGNYAVNFNGAPLPSGIYFYRLQAGDYSETKKMILMR